MIKLSAFSDEAGSSLEEQISALKANGVYYTELRSIGGKNVSDFTEEEAKEYQKILEENSIKTWSIGSPLGKVDINTDFTEYLKKVKHVIKLAKIFKTDKIRVFSFYNAYDKEDLVFKYLQEMVDLANGEGIKLCHENEKDIYGDTYKRVLKIRENVKGLYYVYDPANYLQVKDKASDTLENVADISLYFHVKDVIVKTGELVPAGEGDGNVLELIKRIKGDTVLTVEPHLKIFDSYKSIDNTEIKNKYAFSTNVEAFTTAINATKELLQKAGYKEENGEFTK